MFDSYNKKIKKLDMTLFEFDEICRKGEEAAKLLKVESGCVKRTIEAFDDGIIEMDEVQLLDVRVGCDSGICPDDRMRTFLESLTYVGIMPEEYDTYGENFPHNRDFHLLAEVGDFRYQSETVLDWYIPELGAEKLTREMAKESSVLSCPDVKDHVITGVRDKIDGIEAIVYGIRTCKGIFFFYWDDEVHEPCEYSVAHYEKKDGKMFFLSGDATRMIPGAIIHQWEYPTSSAVKKRLSCEGAVFMIDSTVYRAPVINTCTLYCKDGVAIDKTGKINVVCDKKIEGLYDFKCHSRNPTTWELCKIRRDKVRPDSALGIWDMLDNTVGLVEVLERIAFPISGLDNNRDFHSIVFPIENKDKQIVSKLTFGYPIIIENIKVKDKFKRELATDFRARADYGKYVPQGRLNSVFFLPVFRKNVIYSSGQAYRIPRHKKTKIYRRKGKLYSTDKSMCDYEAYQFVLDNETEDTILMNGQHVIRCFKVIPELEDDFIRSKLIENYNLADEALKRHLDSIDFHNDVARRKIADLRNIKW